MSSYLDTIRQLQSHIENKDVIKKVKQYNSYEDYLHQRNGKQKTEKKIPTYSKIVNRIDEEKTHTTAPQSNIKYFPIQRTQIQYKTNAKIQRVPKVVKKVEYVQKREVQMIPKQVKVTDYYAVQYIRQYVKQIVPEKKIQSVTKQKKIKRYEDVPVQKQIIFYPEHITDVEEAKRQARVYLEERGVTVKENAEYRPISQQESSRIAFSQKYQAAHKTEELNIHVYEPPKPQMVQSKSALILDKPTENIVHQVIKEEPPKQPEQTIPQTQTSSHMHFFSQYADSSKPYYHLSRPQHKQALGDSYSKSIKKTSISNIPTFQPQKYDLKYTKSQYRDTNNLDYTFSQKGQFRYDSAVASSSKRIKS